VVVAFLAPSVDVGRIGFAGPRGTTVYVLLVGIAFGALGVFIWRGRLWAMVVACVLAALLWLALAGFHPSFWRDATWWAPPVVFGLLTVICIASARRASAAIPPF
jgi:hypothetical protein